MNTSELAINGGTPVRTELLPYSRPLVEDEDKKAVQEVLSSGWLTTGPKVEEFEKAFASFVGTEYAVAVNSGTAALHATMSALGITKGDDVIVPTMTFAATANAVVYQGGTPVFVDSDAGTLLIDPTKVEEAITDKTKAIIAVDYAGQPCDYDALQAIAKKHQVKLIADACHALGATDGGRTVGSLADISTFSFHAVKPLATGEGGMITTNDKHLADHMKQFRNHGINSDHHERHKTGSWFYRMDFLGFNYRLPDILCALGVEQLKHVPNWTARRQEIAELYDKSFAEIDGVTPLGKRPGATHAYHLYVVNVDGLSASRTDIFDALRAEGIGANVHYIPVHLHPFYQEHFGTKEHQFPNAENAYEHILSLPIFADMTNEDTADTVKAVEKVCAAYR
ncbi:MAG: UDP-4-amino-4,6-dideoxy-N-acetyl-beta-L-altrosamine transaminase [Candidatus Peregrinibacteria bacterium]|nr:UDP-4-amino-4,6-dideoxy-N-acetyl-beta-L-altrosamine transaminase [Candidatus Peregrinibacteria bacterium]MCB9807982.1 UDP-4-amino-4,6-dideoxy-N-acetyl-beta-L-altrosamine transaminase [Candidatus Peribacteria bacterium]